MLETNGFWGWTQVALERLETEGRTETELWHERLSRSRVQQVRVPTRFIHAALLTLCGGTAHRYMHDASSSTSACLFVWACCFIAVLYKSSYPLKDFALH